ncbi:unnamed protein product [Allacma fusca]|uniref:CRIB domain-containing protein n=1 Tax=Allacma fusca TaxID=39272 RepID=A0A8J2PW63_9HEXA|nr:unnamed protein product [Allacma fusca]
MSHNHNPHHSDPTIIPPNSIVESKTPSEKIPSDLLTQEDASNFRDISDNNLETTRHPRNERLLEQVAPDINNDSTHLNVKGNKGGRKDRKKGGLRKKDIGLPTDFRHVQHVGWDHNTGSDLDVHDKDFQALFERVGVPINQLEDEATRQFIYDFIEKHGGMEDGISSQDQLNDFRDTVTDKLKTKCQNQNGTSSRLLEQKSQQVVPENDNGPTRMAHPPKPLTIPNGTPITPNNCQINDLNAKGLKGGRNCRKKVGLRKEDIGYPMDFRHVQHIDLNPSAGYALDVHDKDFQSFFEKIGVSMNELDDETRKFIYNFIEKHRVSAG